MPNSRYRTIWKRCRTAPIGTAQLESARSNRHNFDKRQAQLALFDAIDRGGAISTLPKLGDSRFIRGIAE